MGLYFGLYLHITDGLYLHIKYFMYLAFALAVFVIIFVQIKFKTRLHS